MKKSEFFFAPKHLDKSKLVQVTQIFKPVYSKKNYIKKKSEKDIHIQKVINSVFMSYTRSYPHFPPTK